MRPVAGSKVKVCVDAGPLENGHRERGIGRCTRDLLNALTPELIERHGVDAQYLARQPAEDGILTGARFAPRSRVAEWSATNGRLPYQLTERWKALETALILPHEVQITGAEVFLSTDPQAVAISRKFRTVALLYDLIPLRYPAQYRSRSSVIRRASYAHQWNSVRRADHLLAISETTRRDAIELLNIPPGRISVAPLAVDHHLFRPVDPETARLNVGSRYGIDRPYLFYVGGFDPRKNVAMLIRAFGVAVTDGSVLLVIAGALGKLGELLRDEVRSTALAYRIRWLGYIPEEDLPALYAGALALVYPSLYEGFGLPVLEAMSCGAPVVTSPVSSLPEVAGDAALYADPTSAAMLADALRRIAGEPDLQVELRARGLERARRFSWTETARRVLQACTEVSRGA